jgi:hypothetical protein
MPPAPRPPFRLDLWSAPAPAGGARVAFLAEPGAGRAVLRTQRTRLLEPGQSRLSFPIAPTHPALAQLVPQQSIVRLTRFVPTTPDTYDEVWEEWRVLQRRRPVRREAGPYEIVCVPLEDDMLDGHLHREVSGGGLALWRYGCVDRTPEAVLEDVRDGMVAAGYGWVEVGTVDPTTPVTFALEGTATPRAIVTALLEALAALGVTAEFQFTRASDGSAYRLELVDRVAGAMPALVATTDAAAHELTVDENAAEQVNVVIPFAADGTDLRELQVVVTAVDGGTGWVTLAPIGAATAAVVAMDDQWNGRRLFRELTGRSFAILDSSASPTRVQLAVADLASGLAAGERVSLRESEDLAGTRRAFGTPSVRSPFRVVSTLTSPARINTEDLQGAGATVHAANQYRDWEVQRSTLVAALPTGTFDHVAGTWVFGSAPSAAPAVGDWIWCAEGEGFVPGTVTNWNAGTNTATVVPRYAGTQFAASASGIAGARCYRPAGSPMWITASAVSGNQLTVSAFSGGTPSAGDVLEPMQRHQGVRLVEVRDPLAITETRRRVGTLQVPCTGATNRVPNADLTAWAGASGDPPDGWTIVDVVGTVTRSRTTAALETRHGGKAWKFAFAAGASAELRSPLIPIHPVPGMMQCAVAWALLFQQFTGSVPIEVAAVAVNADGTRTPLTALAGEQALEAFSIFPPDTSATVDDGQRAALDTWYDAVLTNLSLADITDESLQLIVRRPAGASNPACTLVLDAVQLLQREGLPEAAEGGVRYVFGSDATPMLAAAQELLRDRARPLLRFEGKLLDLYRLDGLRYAPFELVPGRDVDLRVPALDLQRTVRLLGVTEDLDDPTQAQVVLDRVRPDVGRLLASKFATPITLPAGTPASGGRPYANVQLVRTAYSATQITLLATSTCPGRTPPQVRIASLAGGVTIASGPSVGTPAGSGQTWVINRNANGGGAGLVVVETVGAGFVGDTALAVIEEQGIELFPLLVRLRVIASDANTITVRVAVADPLPQGAASATITWQNQGAAAVTPASGQTVTPQATLTEAAGTYADFVITKPGPTAADGRVTFTVTAANRIAAVDAQDVPPAVVIPGVLDVDLTLTDTIATFVWSGAPTVQYRIDKGGWGAPPASPFNVSRGSVEFGADRIVEFRVTGATHPPPPMTYLVPRQLYVPPPTIDPPSLSGVSAAEQTGINCTPPGWALTVNYTVADPNLVDFYIEIRRASDDSVMATGLPCETGSEVVGTGVLGDSSFSIYGSIDIACKVQIRHVGDNALEDELTTNTVASGTYGDCT